jgi:hypothetical protein
MAADPSKRFSLPPEQNSFSAISILRPCLDGAYTTIVAQPQLRSNDRSSIIPDSWISLCLDSLSAWRTADGFRQLLILE